MFYCTQDFMSPTGGIMIFAEYNAETKELLFKKAKDYYYPQDSKNMVDGMNADNFIKENSTFRETIEEAAEYLEQLAICESLLKCERV